jgi:hypothetical protein
MCALLSGLKSFKKIILWFHALLCTLFSLNAYTCGQGNGTVCPPTNNIFKSQNGELDIIMIAQAPSGFTLFPSYSGVVPWTWSMCYSSDFDQTTKTCNSPQSANDQYAGPLIQLQQGDTLNITLINQLPKATNIANLENIPYLFLNPTNIHTHGLIVLATTYLLCYLIAPTDRIRQARAMIMVPLFMIR